MRISTNTISYEKNVQKIFWALSGFCVLFLSLYIFFVSQAVFNTVVIKNFSEKIGKLSAEVGSLESEYLSLKNNITLGIAHEMGFQSGADTSYITKKTLGSAQGVAQVQ